MISHIPERPDSYIILFLLENDYQTHVAVPTFKESTRSRAYLPQSGVPDARGKRSQTRHRQEVREGISG